MFEVTEDKLSLVCTKECTLWGAGSAITVEEGRVVVVQKVDDDIVMEYGPACLFELPVADFMPECFELMD